MEVNLTLVLTALVALGLFLLWRQTRSGYSILRFQWRRQQQRQPQHQRNSGKGEEITSDEDTYNQIEPRDGFDWSATAPIKIRPFKPKFHLTMGLENCPLSELLEVDDTYLDRIRLRKSVLDSNPEDTHQCNSPCGPAVLELYSWLFGIYLPKRYPSMYELRSLPVDGEIAKIDSTQPTHLHNIAAQTNIPLTPSSPKEALYTISANIDTDFLILLPSSTDPTTRAPIYHLEAFTCCFPAGFSLPQKLSLPLAGIHKPVPRYGDKLEKSMDRFFSKLETGRAVKRHNWSVTTTDRLFQLGRNHLYAADENNATQHSRGEEGSRGGATENAKTLDVHAEGLEAMIEAQKKTVHFPDCRLRCERQTLHRLPQSRAIVFAFKTYLYPFDEIKQEGNGEALAEAIEGMRTGSVPEIEFYKRGVVWGEKVREYLRS